MENNKVSFTRWLKRQHKRDDPIGDLSKDARHDPDWPQARKLKSFLIYLTERGACRNAKLALQKAWAEYEEFVNRTGNNS